MIKVTEQICSDTQNFIIQLFDSFVMILIEDLNQIFKKWE